MQFPTLSSVTRPTRTRTAPSGYEKVRILFHAVRTAQLVSAVIVGGIMSYFIYYLTHDHYDMPWTFIVLSTVSLLTVAVLTFTILLHFCSGLNPLFNLLLNTILATIWAMGFGMLSYYMWHTLTHVCDITNWHDETGIMVCRIYKAVFTFSLLGLVSTISALALDLHIFRLSRRYGTHVRLDNLDAKTAGAPASRGPYTDTDHLPLSSEEDLPRHSEAFEVPTRGYGARTYSSPFGEQAGVGTQGYSVPENQFDYDTVYHHGDGSAVGLGLYGTR
ncbi:hypothetical protein BDV97DRAFT_175619 [Delphinella strobiligena]|nr:hypothetical protein BDV97DRAFT_175619 [Delphinella strobiligena]